jgi:hypothetical protein
MYAFFIFLGVRCSGAVRVSLGYNSTQVDCDALLRFLTEVFLDQAPEPLFSVAEGGGVVCALSEGMSQLQANSLFLTPRLQTDAFDIFSDGKDNMYIESSTVPRPIRLAAIYVYPIKSCAGTFLRNKYV